MDELCTLAQVLETLLKGEAWRPQEAKAILRAGRALAREKGTPGGFDLLLFEDASVPPSAA